jgi:hypothetical protein
MQVGSEGGEEGQMCKVAQELLKGSRSCGDRLRTVIAGFTVDAITQP